MATDYTHVPAQPSVSEVLKLVVLEHQELRAQYKQVSTRIRNLRIAVKTLRNLGGRISGGARQEGQADDSSNVQSRADEIHADAEPANHQAANHQAADSQSGELQRAIRIAVFETSGVISSEEVHARILRRGSFSFANQDLAEQAIAEELKEMAEHGDVLRVDTAAGSGWQRILRGSHI